MFIRNMGSAPIVSETEYFKNDISFKKKHIDAMMSNNCLICQVLNILNISLGIRAVTLIIFGKLVRMKYVYSVVKEELGRSLWDSLIHFGGNNITMTISVNDILSERFMKANICVEYSCLERIIRSMEDNGMLNAMYGENKRIVSAMRRHNESLYERLSL